MVYHHPFLESEHTSYLCYFGVPLSLEQLWHWTHTMANRLVMCNTLYIYDLIP